MADNQGDTAKKPFDSSAAPTEKKPVVFTPLEKAQIEQDARDASSGTNRMRKMLGLDR